MTYNIRGGLGIDSRRSLERVSAVVRESAVDVAGLQEVHQRLPQSCLGHQPRVLSRLTGMNCFFGPALARGIGRYGNAVLSRLPTRQEGVYALPGEGEPRAALAVGITMDNRPLSLFCTHFGLSTAARMEQARALMELIGRAGRPVVVVGDLNAGPDAPEVQALLAAGLRHAAPPQEPTFPSHEPRHRIDYILLSPELVSGRCQVLASPASDHRPVVADVHWRAEA